MDQSFLIRVVRTQQSLLMSEVLEFLLIQMRDAYGVEDADGDGRDEPQRDDEQDEQPPAKEHPLDQRTTL